MAHRTRTYRYATETVAKTEAERHRASAIPGYSEVYVRGPHLTEAGVWQVTVEEHSG